MAGDYAAFLASRTQGGGMHGFSVDPDDLNPALFGFQRELVRWSLTKGRGALLVDCGLGKSLMELVWADRVARHTGKPVLILTPLAVAPQLVAEGVKFGIESARSHRGELDSRIVVTNYERLHHFDPDTFGGVVCDESSALKAFDGQRRRQVTEFMRRMPYRLLATATAAPNDYTELGTSSEALGELGHMDMLARFFTNDQKSSSPRRNWAGGDEWRLRGHAEGPFWRWVASWARSMRRPSDLGFSDDGFVLPPPTLTEHVVSARSVAAGRLFEMPAHGFREEREERRRTMDERCETVAGLVSDTGHPAVVWCELNAEGDLLERLIPGAIQVAGKDSDEAKEERFAAFASGQARVLVCKPLIAGFGLNWQHCAHLTFFPTHSYERWYQAVRRCWRFGQERQVVVDLVLTEGERDVMENMRRKAEQADRMFADLTAAMGDALTLDRSTVYGLPASMPAWMKRAA